MPDLSLSHLIFVPHASMNLKLALLFLAIITGISLVLKPIAILTNRAKWRALARGQRILYWITPIVALHTAEKSVPNQPALLWATARKALTFGLVVILYYLIFWSLLRRHVRPYFWEGFYAVPLAYFLGEFLGSCIQLVGALFSGYVLSPFHRQPLRSESVRDFWSNRWNTWVSDTFRELFLNRIERKAFYFVAAIFLISGVFHEFLINIPYLLLSRRNLLGSMMVYFILQIIGLYLERTSFRPGTLSNRLFAYMVVLVPAPLVMNEALLHMICIWPH